MNYRNLENLIKGLWKMSLLGQIICYSEKPQHVKYANGWGFSPLCRAK
jgi:hypothetical protein